MILLARVRDHPGPARLQRHLRDAEIGLVSARRARLQPRAAEGDAGAALALELARNPQRFLSAVQVGITLVGVLAGAFGGASLAGQLAPYLQQVPRLAPKAETIAFGLVVALITYLSLIIGELVPKNLALRSPEAIASRMARPMQWLARIALPLVWFLGVSTHLVMKLFGEPKAKTGPTRDIRGLVTLEDLLEEVVGEMHPGPGIGGTQTLRHSGEDG